MELQSQYQDLLVLLEKISEAYRLLLECLVLENSQMSNVNVKELLETAQTKEVLLSEIIHADELRQKIVLGISLANGRTSENLLTLQELVALAPEQFREKLSKYQKVLSIQMQNCKNQNQINMQLAETSLERIDVMKTNILGKNNNNAENYNAQGSRNPISEHGGRLLSQKA